MEREKLPKLPKKMNNFVMRFATNGNNASEAYRFAYDTKGMASNTVWSEASKLLKHHKVTPWLKWAEENEIEVQKEEIKYTTKQAISEADELMLMALEPQGKYKEPNLSAVSKFFELKNKLAGNFKEDNEQGRENTVINVIRPEANPA